MRFPEFSGEWKSIKLGDALKLKGGYAFKSEKFQDSGVPVVRISNLPQNSYSVDLSDCVYYECGNYQNYTVKNGDLLIAMSGATTGKTAIYRYDYPAYLNQRVGLFAPKELVHNQFLYPIVESKTFISQLGSKLVAGAQPNISSQDIETIAVGLPSKEEQIKIAHLFELLNQKIETQSKIIEEQETLLRSLRHKIYSRVQAESQCTIADVLCYEQPTKYLVTDTDYTDDDSQVPVLTANKAFILGYTTENFGIYDKGPCIILDDFTLDCKYVDFKFKVKSSAIKILRAKAKTNLRFIFEYFRFLALNTTEHRRHYIAEIEPMSILLPSNEEIDRIARLFTALDERLEVARKELKILESQKMYMLQKMFI